MCNDLIIFRQENNNFNAPVTEDLGTKSIASRGSHLTIPRISLDEETPVTSFVKDSTKFPTGK